MEFCKKNDLYVSLSTNGSLVTNENAKELSKYLKRLQVSLDGWEETYSKIREPKRFYQILENIKILRRYMDVTTSTVLTKDTLNDLDKIYNFCKENGVKMRIIRLKLIGNASKNRTLLEPSLDDYIKFNNWLKGKSVILDEAFNFLDSFEKRAFCGAGKTACLINTKGDVYPCPWFFLEEFKMGNVFKENFIDIWNNEKFTNFRKKIESSECFACKEKCGGGCRAVAYEKTKDLGGIDPICYEMKCKSVKSR